MTDDKGNYIEYKTEIIAYIAKLRYLLDSNNVKLIFQKERVVDENRNIKYTNRYTIGDLFPDEDPLVAIKRELRTIKVGDYIHTVKDKRYKDKADMRVFGKEYHNGDVYIKIRVELLAASQNELGDYIFVMSFHYSTIDFVNICFPYKKDGR